MSSGGEKSFLQELWEKGFIRIVFSYLLGAWALLQFVDWLVLRYHISPLWTDLVFAFLLAMLPSVFLYTYYHKSTESKRWRKLEKIVIPSNVIVALGLVIFLFAGKSLSATASEVTITNESGEQVQRLVTSSKLIKRLVFFPSET